MRRRPMEEVEEILREGKGDAEQMEKEETHIVEMYGGGGKGIKEEVKMHRGGGDDWRRCTEEMKDAEEIDEVEKMEGKKGADGGNE